MDLKFFWKLFVIDVTIAWTLCFTFGDVCHPKDKGCLRPSIRGLGDLMWGHCCSLGVLRRIGSISLLECAKECFLTTGCFSLNYRHNWHVCELLERHENGESNCNAFLRDGGCVHSNISTWTKKLSGKCVDHHCAAGQRCYFDVGSGVKCKVAYCFDEPHVLNGSPDEYFGPSRDVRHGVKYKCVHNFRLVGKPYVACSDRGDGHAEWDILFSCYPGNCPHDNGYLYNQDLHICYKLHRVESQYTIAKEKCKQENGSLMRIDMEAKQDHIVQYLKTQGEYLANTDFVFIQGSHNKNDGSSLDWRYDDGTQMDYLNWYPNQPDSTSPTGTDYLSLYKPDDFKWHDVWSTYIGIPLCEIDLAT